MIPNCEPLSSTCAFNNTIYGPTENHVSELRLQEWYIGSFRKKVVSTSDLLLFE